MTGDQLTDDLGTWLQDPLVIAIAAGVVLLVILLIVFAVRRRRRRQAELERQFGSEYERTVSQGSRRGAEQDLRSRADRHQGVELRWLTSDERDRFRARFESIQASFVDSPDSAVQAADGLLDEVAASRGYPDGGDRERRLSDVSVDYPDEVAAHRRGLAQLGGEDRPTTEHLRQALLSARTLFDRLVGVGDDASTPSPPDPLVHAPSADDHHATDARSGSTRTGQPDEGEAADEDHPIVVGEEAGYRRDGDDTGRGDRRDDNRAETEAAGRMSGRRGRDR